MPDQAQSGITGIQVLIPTQSAVVSYRIVEADDGWQIHDPAGTVVERAATVERALSVAACLSAMGQAALVEPYGC